MKRAPHLPRLLHGRSQYGYTTRASEALTMEPEAVSADEQRQITRAAHQTADEREHELLIAAQDRIGAELDFLAAQRLDRRTASHVRAMQRQLVQLTRKRSSQAL